MENKKIFRFDDVSINSNMEVTNRMAAFLLEKFPNCTVLFGVSPLVHDMSKEGEITKERVFPKILNALSDYRNYYMIDLIGIPEFINGITLASHGLIHVDHRLLPRDVQEISILISSSLVKSKIFIPPFNKWNKDTESVCNEHGIELIKFESGWLSLEHNKFNSNHDKWYLHAREFSLDSFKKWFE